MTNTGHLEIQGDKLSYTIEARGFHEKTAYGDAWPHYRWTARFRMGGKALQIGYMTGTGLTGIPSPEAILESAFRDAETAKWETFEGFVDEFGYDLETDYAKARRIYNACERMDARLDRFFGNRREDWGSAVSESDQ